MYEIIYLVSYKLIKSDSSYNILKEHFTSFVINCFEKGIESIIK